MPPKGKTAKPKPQGIQAGVAYPSEKFMEAMGWGRKAFKSARDRGLPTHKESRYIYVLGDEAIEWMRNAGAAS